jgi:X-Pro dipeptidyl-peptidase
VTQGVRPPKRARLKGLTREGYGSLSVDRNHAQLAPLLVDVAPDGTTETVSRGFLNLQYRDGLAIAKPLPPGEPVRATVTFKPQDQLFEAGHRIGVILQGSNTVWAIPDDPGATYTVNDSALLLPLS